jgi:hypothetical protein
MAEVSVLAIGDPHSKLSNQDDLRECADRSSAVILERKPNLTVVMGDLFDGHEHLHVTTLNGASYFLKRCLSACVEVNSWLAYLIGNHDCENNQWFLEPDRHALVPFKGWPGLTVVDWPRVLSPAGIPFVLCPYVPPGRFQEALDSIQYAGGYQSCRAIFCHQEFLGADLDGIVSRHGDKWDGPPVAISGHIHEASQLGESVIYVGAPMGHKFSETGPKSISLFRFGDAGMTQEKIDLNLRKKLTVTLTIEAAKTYEIPVNTSVRINLVGTSEEHTAFKKTARFNELKAATKIIPKLVDYVVVQKDVERRGYVALLRQQCARETKPVQEALDEVLSAPTT